MGSIDLNKEYESWLVIFWLDRMGLKETSSMMGTIFCYYWWNDIHD